MCRGFHPATGRAEAKESIVDPRIPAFILAAGLGTRLRPLTDVLPKPLVPLLHRPLVTYAMDALVAAGVGTIALNTHHLPGAFSETFGTDPSYRDHPLRLFHEPLLLDTGGGIRNARAALDRSTFFLYNGDILAELPLADALVKHRSSGALATLLLRPRSGGGTANVRFDECSGCVLDLRGHLGSQEGEECVYSGVALFEPGIFNWIPSEGPYSIIDALLEAMRGGEKVGGVLSSHGHWSDLGTPSAYLEAHRLLLDPNSHTLPPRQQQLPCIHPEAYLESGVTLQGMAVIGPRSLVGAGSLLEETILWPDSVILPGASLEGCIVTGTRPVQGAHQGAIL